MSCRCGQKNGLETVRQGAIGVGDLQFVFKIAHRPQSPQDEVGAMGFGAMDSETVETDDFDAAEMSGGCSDLAEAIIDAEGRALAWVAEHGHHHFTEQGGGPLDQIHVSVREWIEASGIKRPHGR